MLEGASGQVPKAAVNRKSCAYAKDALARSLSGKSFKVVVSKATVTRSGNPTARKQSLIFIVGPADKSFNDVVQATENWQAASGALGSVTLEEVKPVIEECFDVAEVIIGLDHSDFFREFAVTKEPIHGRSVVVIERDCSGSEGTVVWEKQYCFRSEQGEEQEE
jgi:hypothetical protein